MAMGVNICSYGIVIICVLIGCADVVAFFMRETAADNIRAEQRLASEHDLFNNHRNPPDSTHGLFHAILPYSRLADSLILDWLMQT